MRERMKKLVYTAPKSGDKIELEVGDKGTVLYRGRVLRQHIMSLQQGYVYCVPPAEFSGMLPVHRLVALAWVEGRTKMKDFVDHKNSDSFDNRAENLRWVTKKANNRTKHSRKAKSANARHANHCNECIRAEKDGEVRYFMNGYIAAREIGCTHPLIYNVLNPDHWAKRAKGWELLWVPFDMIPREPSKS